MFASTFAYLPFLPWLDEVGGGTELLDGGILDKVL